LEKKHVQTAFTATRRLLTPDPALTCREQREWNRGTSKTYTQNKRGHVSKKDPLVRVNKTNHVVFKNRTGTADEGRQPSTGRQPMHMASKTVKKRPRPTTYERGTCESQRQSRRSERTQTTCACAWRRQPSVRSTRRRPEQHSSAFVECRPVPNQKNKCCLEMRRGQDRKAQDTPTAFATSPKSRLRPLHDPSKNILRSQARPE
jgi:hypothetical protein